jgi:adenosylcobinamide-GDP ribazoletransferase
VIKSFLLALQFLTIIPVRIKSVTDKALAHSMIYFPLIGLILAGILIAVYRLLNFLRFPDFASSAMLALSLIFLTGGMHLDGLSDTFDALFSGKPKAEMLKIIRDSHAGVMGILALISVILLKVSFLFSVGGMFKPAALILMCVFSRWAMVFSMSIFPYAREEGKAKVFIQGMTPGIFVWATAVTLASIFLVGKISGLFILGICALVTFAFGKIITRKLGGITGDTIGATCEITEIIVLFAVCIIERSDFWITLMR